MGLPKVLSGALSELERYLARYDVALQPLLDELGMDRPARDDPYARMPLDQFARILEAATFLTCDGEIGLRLSVIYDPWATGLLGYAAENAPTLRDKARSWARYAGFWISGPEMRFEEGGGVGQLTWETPELYCPVTQIVDLGLGHCVSRLRRVAGKAWSPITVDIAHGAPEDVAPYRQVFGPNVRFRQPVNRIVIDSATLNRTQRGTDPRLFALLSRCGEELLHLPEHQEEEDFIWQVRERIAHGLALGSATVSGIASDMGVSSRTLQRQLSRAGTSFSKLVDATRKGLAEHYLLDTRTGITEIAYRLGFSDVSAFTRAAHRWFGMAPRYYRQSSGLARGRTMPPARRGHGEPRPR